MRRTVLVLALVAAAALGGDSERPSNPPEEVAYKRRHLARCLDELARRDTSHLTEEQRAARARCLDTLRAYAERGVFPLNTRYPGREIPYLVDDYGTRCALAHLIDASGRRALLERLAARDNHAYVWAFRDDRDFAAWLVAQGLTVEEVAFIQAPGFIDDSDVPPEPEPVPEPPPPPPPDPGHPLPEEGGAPQPAPTPSGSGPATPGRDFRGPTTARRATGAAVADWERWWHLNRDTFLNLRAHYHAHFPSTRDGRANPRRPSEGEIATRVLPLLHAAAVDGDRRLRGTALLAWARAARPADAEAVVEATLAYVRDPEHGYRDLVLLGLGFVHDAAGVAPLREILRDTKDGRRTLERASGIPDRTRAFAALALGESGDAGAIGDLRHVLAEERGRAVELRVACVAALGRLAPAADPGTRKELAGFLLDRLQSRRLAKPVLAALPHAIARTGDDEARAALRAIVGRFRGPTEIRQSAALALGATEPGLDEALVTELMDLARRDPDATGRRFAIAAIGELCARDVPAAARPSSPLFAGAVEAHEPTGLERKLTRFFDSALGGLYRQPDMPWFYLSAALFGRRFEAQSDAIAERLVKAAREDASVDGRAAAALALGLLNNPATMKDIHRLFVDARDQKLRGYLAEAAGLLGDRSLRDRLRTICREDPSGQVRYHAAIGLGFLADSGVVPLLVEELATTSSRPALSALTRVIGGIGDRSAVDGLARIAQDDDMETWRRQRALGALGMLAETGDRSWNYAYRHGANFAQAVGALEQLLFIF